MERYFNDKDVVVDLKDTFKKSRGGYPLFNCDVIYNDQIISTYSALKMISKKNNKPYYRVMVPVEQKPFIFQ
jgi:hypothetical protein